MGADDSILKALRDKGGRTQSLIEDVNNHLKSLKEYVYLLLLGQGVMLL